MHRLTGTSIGKKFGYYITINWVNSSINLNIILMREPLMRCYSKNLVKEEVCSGTCCTVYAYVHFTSQSVFSSRAGKREVQRHTHLWSKCTVLYEYPGEIFISTLTCRVLVTSRLYWLGSGVSLQVMPKTHTVVAATCSTTQER